MSVMTLQEVIQDGQRYADTVNRPIRVVQRGSEYKATALSRPQRGWKLITVLSPTAAGLPALSKSEYDALEQSAAGDFSSIGAVGYPMTTLISPWESPYCIPAAQYINDSNMATITVAESMRRKGINPAAGKRRPWAAV